MLKFTQYLAARGQLPKNMKVDLSSMSEKDRRHFERVKEQFQGSGTKTKENGRPH